MFCKMCSDANKPGFNLHNLKDRAGNTTCPYLLNLKCLNCGIFGHTTRYCRVKSVPEIKVKKPLPVIPKVVPIKKALNFQCLYNYDDEDIDMDDEVEDEYAYLNPSNVMWGKGLRDMVVVVWADC